MSKHYVYEGIEICKLMHTLSEPFCEERLVDDVALREAVGGKEGGWVVDAPQQRRPEDGPRVTVRL
jgi:hypothetical protein